MGEKTKLVVLNSPANPTGGVLTAGDVATLAGILRRRPDVHVLSDEIYSRLLYKDDFGSIASEDGLGPDGRTIILDGFSKTYAMTGWRLGYGVMPEPLAQEVTKLQVNSNSRTSAATQHAGLAALRGPQDAVETMLAEFRARRDLTVDGLNELRGVECITGTGYCADELADLLLREAGVACLSGTAFGRHGEGHLRLSYANSRENIGRALDRMNEFLSRAAG